MGIEIFDVWESTETFEVFGAHLMPILAEFGVDPSEPQDQRDRVARDVD